MKNVTLASSRSDHKLHLLTATLWELLLEWSHPGVNAAEQVGDLLWGRMVLSLVTSVFPQQMFPGVLDFMLEVKSWWYHGRNAPNRLQPSGQVL